MGLLVGMAGQLQEKWGLEVQKAPWPACAPAFSPTEQGCSQTFSGRSALHLGV